jgi:hypothetical protein
MADDKKPPSSLKLAWKGMKAEATGHGVSALVVLLVVLVTVQLVWPLLQ